MVMHNFEVVIFEDHKQLLKQEKNSQNPDR